jgi:hypothetical protein
MPPTSTPRITTRTAEVELLAGGIVQVRILPEVLQTLDDAAANLSACASFAGTGRHPPLLLDLRFAKPLEAEVRHFLSGPRVEASFAAIALVFSGNALGRMMGNVYLKVARPRIPTKLFQDPEPALAWLRPFAPPAP